MRKEVRFIKQDVVVPNGTAPATQEFNIQLPKEFQQCTGIAFVQVTDGGLPRYNIGIKDYEGHELVQKQDRTLFLTALDVAPNERFRSDMPFDITPQQSAVMIETFAATTSELRLQVVWRCERIIN